MRLLGSSGQCRFKPRLRVLLGGQVYDVTDFADRHPGGKEVLEKNNGLCVGEAMQNPAVHVHSKAAYAVLEKYLVAEEDSLRHQNDWSNESPDKCSLHEEYYNNDLVDWSKPMLGQVEFLGDKYFDWTHVQVDRPIRLFASDYAEMLTKAHWWFVPITWLPIGFYYVYTSLNILSQAPEVWPQNALGCQLGPACLPVLLAVGILVWTLLEYVIHRWLFHLRPPTNVPFLIRLHFSLHGQHHKSPMDPLRLVFPPLPALVFAILIYATCMTLLPRGLAFGVLAGILFGYVTYDLTHYYIHHGQPSSRYFRRLKTFHMHHHYKHQHLGFGISSKLWDYPFGTRIPEDEGMLKTK
ncbi:hypothetical protein BsWGS_22252 [Bradybaena similaris]